MTTKYHRDEWKQLNQERYNEEATLKQTGGASFWRVDEISSRFLVLRRLRNFLDKALTQRSPQNGSQLILEVGCGSGGVSTYLAQPQTKIIGLDIAPGMAKLASQKHPDTSYSFLASDGERLPFAAGCFDKVAFVASLHHLPSARNAIKEACRVTGCEGEIIFFEPNGKSLIANWIRKLTVRYQHSKYAEDPLNPDKVIEILRENNLSIISQEFIWSIGYAYPHLVARIPFKRLFHLFLPLIYLVDTILGRNQHLGWVFGIVARKVATPSQE
jgi:ubiquinone/menaquinone biosynthesis C-methylase UbiE